MYLIHRLLGIVPWLCLGGLIVLLEQRFSRGVGVSIYATIVVLMTLSAAMLLRSPALERPGWRNVVAGQLLPFSWLAGYGSLQKLCLVNLLGSMVFGLAGFMGVRFLHSHDFALSRIGFWSMACAFAWIVLIGMALFLIRQYGKRYYAGPSGLRKFLKLLAAPVGALMTSIMLVVVGLPFPAFIVAMIPIAIVFVPITFLLTIVITT